jgi:hypothetical protein
MEPESSLWNTQKHHEHIVIASPLLLLYTDSKWLSIRSTSLTFIIRTLQIGNNIKMQLDLIPSSKG